MKISKLILWLILASISTALLTVVFYNTLAIEKTVNLNMTVKVDDHFGLAVDNESLNFGKIIPGQGMEKSILLANPTEHDVRVLILNYGNISDWIRVSDYNFILEHGSKKNLTYEVFAPSDASFGKYTGKSQIIFKRVIFT